MPIFLCPNCNESVQPVHRAGVELDICPKCRGIWLDRGELEKILDHERTRSGQDANRPEAPRDRDHADQRHLGGHDEERYRREHRPHDDRERHLNHGGRRKKGLSIFDIFD
jgi:Zn-finger nucleic acid-binding protein